MKDRFDLESDINNCWNLVDDILFLAGILEKDYVAREDMVKMLEGLALVYNRKFHSLEDTFKQVLSLDQYYKSDDSSNDIFEQYSEMEQDINNTE